MKFNSENFEYGPVVVIKGAHQGRIGMLDDETFEKGRLHGIVYFGGFGLTLSYRRIPITYLRRPTSMDLLSRHEIVWRRLTSYSRSPALGEERIGLLEEYSYIASLLNQKMFEAQFMHKHDGASIFLSHSSADKNFVKSLAVDLAEMGHRPWVDEWQILGGESIPTKIAEGLASADYVLLVLSKKSVASKWVENEWQAKHWDEISSRQIYVIPILIEDCEIPTLLKMKKYIDFREDYDFALEQLGLSLRGHTAKRRPNKG